MKVLFVRPNKDTFGFKPIGLSLLSAIARRLGWQTALFDTTGFDLGYTSAMDSGENAGIFKPVDLSAYNFRKEKKDLISSFSKVLKDFDPDCLAASVLNDEFLIAGQISGAAKKIKPLLPVIWGGKYPTLNPLESLRLHNADFACVGEGLDAFADFLQVLSRGKEESLYRIFNIWAKRNGKIIKNKVRPLRANIDSLPYLDWDIFDKRHFIRIFDGKAYVSGDHMLNWGCPYHCTYCANHFYHRLYENKYFLRRYGTGRIIEELKFLKNKYGLKLFRFLDEDFLMRPVKGLRELSSVYKKQINIPFIIETNPKSVTIENVRLLKDMGCVSASVAIETGDPGLRRKVLGRVDTLKDIMRAFSLFKRFKIRASSFNMLGIPFEDRKSYSKTVELNIKAKVQYPGMGFFYPFEGTRIRKVCVDNGFFDPEDKSRAVYESDRPALAFEELGEQELIQMRDVFVLYVKLPKHYWPFIRRSEIKDSLGMELRKKLLVIYRRTTWANDGWYASGGRDREYLTELKKILKDGLLKGTA